MKQEQPQTTRRAPCTPKGPRQGGNGEQRKTCSPPVIHGIACASERGSCGTLSGEYRVCGLGLWKITNFIGRPADAASAACLECPRMRELSHSTWGARTIGALEAFTQDQVAPSLQ